MTPQSHLGAGLHCPTEFARSSRSRTTPKTLANVPQKATGSDLPTPPQLLGSFLPRRVEIDSIQHSAFNYACAPPQPTTMATTPPPTAGMPSIHLYTSKEQGTESAYYRNFLVKGDYPFEETRVAATTSGTCRPTAYLFPQDASRCQLTHMLLYLRSYHRRNVPASRSSVRRRP
jgi:hypothetical protein